MKKIFSIYMLFFFGFAAMAQPTAKDFIKKGNEALAVNNYSGALFYLAEAYDRDPSDVEVLYKLIQAERSQYAYKPAEQHLHYLLDTLKSTAYPDGYHQLAEIKLQTGQYTDAEKYYQLFLSENDNPAMAKKAELGLNSAKWAQENSDPQEGVQTVNMDINTGYSEHAPLLIDEDLHYSSLSFPFENDQYEPQRYLSKIQGAQIEDLAKANKFNSEDYLTSNSTISADKKYMAYTLCSYLNVTDIQCDIYLSTKDNSGMWTQGQMIGAPVNMTGSTSTQPSFGKSDDGNQELYFVSTRVGGKGGFDIYKTSFNEQLEFTAVNNVQELNTDGNDITPYYDASTGILYFSSDGRIGYGSYDVYKWENGSASNMGLPVNSSYQDIYYVSYDKDKKSFLSSNRVGSKFLDTKFETCCFDIYEVEREIQRMDLLALTYDALTREELTGVKVSLTGGDMDDTKENGDGNDFLFKDIKPEGDYTITATKEGYESTSVTVTGEELMEYLKEGVLEKKLYLTPGSVDLLVKVFEKPTNYELLGATVSLIDITAGDIEVDRITMGESNAFTFQVIPGHCYKIRVNKTGFETVMEQYCIPTDGSKAYKEIYLGRKAVIETLTNLLPLRLYYDNDMPDRSTMNTTTERAYTETYNEYYPLKQKFKDTYGNQFSGDRRADGEYAVENFFEGEVRKGHDNLDIFLETLTRILQRGKGVNLYLRGYASPLSVNEYNVALGKRRVDCVRNEFEVYNGGILMTYINSGQLIITERSFGEEAANQGVSDDPAAPKKSIFSPDASRERRVEIDEIQEVYN